MQNYRERITTALLDHHGVNGVVSVTEASDGSMTAVVVPAFPIALGYPEAFELALQEHVARTMGDSPRSLHVVPRAHA